MQSRFILLIRYDLSMKSIFSGKDIGSSQPGKTTGGTLISQYFVFTEIEFVSLAFCVILDIIEYAAVILMMPVIGDAFDVVGILFCLAIFRGIGLVSLVELVPGADVLPIFIITWLIWYFLKKQKNRHPQTPAPSYARESIN